MKSLYLKSAPYKSSYDSMIMWQSLCKYTTLVIYSVQTESESRFKRTRMVMHFCSGSIVAVWRNTCWICLKHCLSGIFMEAKNWKLGSVYSFLTIVEIVEISRIGLHRQVIFLGQQILGNSAIGVVLKIFYFEENNVFQQIFSYPVSKLNLLLNVNNGPKS